MSEQDRVHVTAKDVRAGLERVKALGSLGKGEALELLREEVAIGVLGRDTAIKRGKMGDVLNRGDGQVQQVEGQVNRYARGMKRHPGR